MSDELPAAAAVISSAAAAPMDWPVLDLQERRVLGVLVEKAKTTPDTYPMSLNSLVAGCNQKSNRDPVLNLSEVEVEDALHRCQKRGLTIRITGSGRVERWRHHLYEAWRLDKVDLAVVGELLLRGPQSEGDLRGRASRMEPIDDLDRLRQVLKPLVDRKLVVYLTPENRRGAVLTHGFHAPNELEKLRGIHGRALEEAPASTIASPRQTIAAPPTVADSRIPVLESRIAELQERLERLEDQVRKLDDTLRQVL